MKILIIISKFPPEYSGPGVRIPFLYSYLEKEIKNINFEVLTGSEEYNTNLDYEYKNFKIRRRVNKLFRHKVFKIILPKKILKTLIYLSDNLIAKSTLKKYKNYDLFHILGHNGLTSGAIKFANEHNIPVMQELVNANSSASQKYFFTPCTFKKGKLVVISSSLKEKAIKDGTPESRIWNRPNPINITKFSLSDNKEPLRKKISNFSNNDIILLSIGKFIKRKNQIFLLDVLEHLPEKFKLILAGPVVSSGYNLEQDQLYLQNIKDKIHSKNLSSRVLLKEGFIDSNTYMKASDIYMLPGWGEGFGTPMLEAMACGLPVISSAEKSFEEWVKDGFNGYVIRSKDAKKWAKFTINASNIKQKEKISQYAIAAASDKKIFNQYHKIIENLVNTGKKNV